MHQKFIFLFGFVFLFFITQHVVEAQSFNLTSARIYLTDFPRGNFQNKYTFDLHLQQLNPLTYHFDVISYETSYKYGGVIKWKSYKFPHGEGTFFEIPGTGQMNITGWLVNATSIQNRFFGLMSVLDLTANKTLFWYVAKEAIPGHMMYGTYWINTTYFP